MDILNSHTDYNKWKVYTGNTIFCGDAVSTYVSLKNYTKELKEKTGESVRKLLVEYVNANRPKNEKSFIINIKDIDFMIDSLNTVTNKNLSLFKAYHEKDIFKAFKFLYKIAY